MLHNINLFWIKFTYKIHIFQMMPEKHHHQNGMMNGSDSSMNVINRLAANNSDITITTTQPPSSQGQHKNGTNGNSHNRSSPTADFLADSPSKKMYFFKVEICFTYY